MIGSCISRLTVAKSAISVMAMVLLVPLAGLQCPPEPPPPPPKVIVIADDPLPDGNGQIVITSAMMPPGQTAPPVGWGLITGNGLHLYKVNSVQTLPDGSIQIASSPGSLSEFNVVGEFQFDNPMNTEEAAKLGIQSLDREFNLQILDVDMPFSTTINLTSDGAVSANVDGTFSLYGTFQLAFDVGFGGLRTFSSSIDGDSSLSLNANVFAQRNTNVAGERAVTQPFRQYYAGAVGGIPIIVEITAQLFVGIDGNVIANASMQSGIDASADVGVGAAYDSSRSIGNRWSTLANAGFNWSYEQPTICFSGSSTLRAYLRPHFEVQLYSLVGPTFDVEPYSRVDASVDGCLGDPSVHYDVILSVGAVGYAKIKADVLDLFVIESPSLTVFDVSRELRRWQNSPPPPPQPQPPICSVSPTSLNFGTVQVGSSLDRSFSITNIGGGALTGNVSESCSHYAITSGGGSYNLGAGQSRTVTVRFAPESTETKNCAVTPTDGCSTVNCTGVGQQDTPLPGTPSNPSPANGVTDVSVDADLDWGNTSGATSYDVYFGTSNPPPQVGWDHSSSSWNLSTLDYETTYYWKVVAINSAGLTAGSVWQFSTPAQPSQLPDLVVSTVTLDTTQISPGGNVDFSYVVANVGADGPSGISTFDVAAYFSLDQVLDASDVEFGWGYSVWSYHLSAGWSDGISDDGPSPASLAPGQYYLIVVADAKPGLPPNYYPGVDEANESNNWRVSTTRLTVSGGGQEWIYFTDSGTESIRRVRADGTALSDVVTGQESPHGIAIDASAGKVYWTDQNANAVKRADLDGSGEESVVFNTSLFNSPIGLALDPSGNRIYWIANNTSVTPNQQAIFRATLSGGNPEVIVNGLGGSPMGLAIDRVNQRLYWTNQGSLGGSDGSMWRVNLSDLSTAPLVITGITLRDPRGIAVDVANGRVYWTDILAGAGVYSASLGGGAGSLLCSDAGTLNGIALDLSARLVYWTNHSDGTMRVGNMDGACNPSDLVSGLGAPWAIALDTE